MKRFIPGTASLALLALTLAVAGCKSADTAGVGSLASVVITGHTAEEVRQTTVEVFGWNDYTQVSDLTFEKKGTRQDLVTYGSWGADSVWIKMRVHLTTKSELRQILGCDVYILEKHGDGFMGSERKLLFAKGDECKKILDQIKQRLSLADPKPS